MLSGTSFNKEWAHLLTYLSWLEAFFFFLKGRKVAHFHLLPPQDVHTLIPRTCDYVTWQRGTEVVDYLTLKWGDYAGLPGGTQCNDKGLSK